MGFRTFAFRSFRRELTRLSRAYWYLDYSIDLANREIEQWPTPVLARAEPLPEIVCPGDHENRLDLSPQGFLDEAGGVADDLRGLILVKAFALAEDYLHCAAGYWAVLIGFCGETPNTLSKPGKAIVKPALVSNVYESSKYLASAIPFDFPDISDDVRVGYLMRCAVAHNGGFVDDELARKVNELRELRGTRVIVDWEALHKYLKCVDQVCERVELALAGDDSRQLRVCEAWWLAQNVLDDRGRLTANDVREVLIQDYGLQSPPSKKHIAEKFGLFYT